jgi:hypothetical protein
MTEPYVEPYAEPPVRVFCTRSYYADIYFRHAFVFRVCETNTRFTVYAEPPAEYTVGGTYLLTLTPETRPTPGAGRSEGDT